MKLRLFAAAAFCGLSLSLFAQKEEIRAFEKQNKPLLKMLKKEYDARPEVRLTEEGEYYILLTRKENGVTRFFLANDGGELLYSEPLDNCKPVKGGSFFIGAKNEAGQMMWGAVSAKGEQLFPLKYGDNCLWHCQAAEAGTHEESSLKYWHPASEECWITMEKDDSGLTHNTFYAADCKTVRNTFVGNMDHYRSYFWVIGKSASANTAGLLTNDGKEIYPQQYNGFYISSSGLVNCIKREPDGLLLYGGKMLDANVSDVEVPALFNDVTYSSSEKVIKCRTHRGDDYFVYDPAGKYEVKFLDNGERLFDRGRFEDVITFYEGEGYGALKGNYYMGLAARALAQAEMAKMDRCISTLKSNTQYYYPIVKPDDYKFDTGTITTMYISAGTYLEKFISNDSIPADDPHMVKAKKLRGEIVTARNNIPKKLSEYGDALSSATARNAQREAAIAARQAQQQAAANSLATGLTNLIFGGAKKR